MMNEEQIRALIVQFEKSEDIDENYKQGVLNTLRIILLYE